MSSWDTTTNRSQPQRQIVVYDPSDTTQGTLAGQLTAADVETTIQTLSDPIRLIDVLTNGTVDCLVCYYGPETPAVTEQLYELISIAFPQLPRVGYIESAAALTPAHELGFSAVHLRHETEDTAALAERVRAAIEITPGSVAEPAPQQLIAASIDTQGTVGQTVGVDIKTDNSDGQPALWSLPWAPDNQAVDRAIEQALADPGQPATTESAVGNSTVIFVVDETDPASTTSTASETEPDQTRVTVLTTRTSDANEADESTQSKAGAVNGATQSTADHATTETIEYEIVDELYRTLTTTRGSVDDRIQALLEVGQSYLDIDTGIVATVDEETYEIEQINSDDRKLGTVDSGDQFLLSDTFCEQTIAAGETYSITDVAETDDDHSSRAVVSEFGACRYLGTPLSVDDETTGTLCFVGTTHQTAAFSPQDRLLTEFMSQLVSYELQHHADKQELQATKTELTELFDRVDDAFYALDTDWQFTYVNEQAETLLETPASTLLGQTVWDVFPNAKQSQFYDQFTEAVETGTSTSFVVEFESLDSWFDVTAYPSGNGLSVYFRDITDQKQRTKELERYKQILETVSDGVYALDPQGHFTYVNEGLADLTGYSRSELQGSHVSICKSESTVRTAENTLREQISRQRADAESADDISLDIEIETADGRTVPCTDHISLLPFEDRFRGSVGTLRDVSAQQKREQTLNGLLTVTRALMTAETTGDVATQIVEAVSEVLGYDRAIVHLVDEESDQLRPEIATETVHRGVETLAEVTIGEGPIGTVFETGASQTYDSATAETVGCKNTASLIVVPLGSYGTLTVGAGKADGFDESDRQLIQLLTANAEEALNRTQRQQTLRRYEMILESVQEMMCVVDSTGEIKLLTDPLARRLDHDRAALVGQQLASFLSEPETDMTTEMLEKLFADQSVSDITFKETLVGENGESVPISVEASQLPHVQGRPEAVVTIHDISDLVSAKEAAEAERERFTYLFENLADPVDEIRVDDTESGITAVNRAFRSLFDEPADIEYELSDETVGAAPIGLDDQRLVDNEATQSLLEEFQSDTERELKLTTSEGTKYFLYRSVPYELDDGLRGFEIYTDITALKQREIQLQVLHRLLRHNLRNDLNVIEGFAELLADELEDEKHQQFADRIYSNATKLAELSETANTIESVAGQRSLSREPVDIATVVQTTTESAAETYQTAEISVDDLPDITVLAGPHIKTAISELIENAIEHNGTATPTVSVSVEVSEETATVSVSDNGPGLPPEEWSVVTGDTEISQLEHGSGLGLWLVRWVTEGYGGKLDCQTQTNGTTVRIRLPLAAADDPCDIA